MLESEQIRTDQEEFCYVICKLCSTIKDSKYYSKVKSKKNILLLFDKLCTDLWFSNIVSENVRIKSIA